MQRLETRHVVNLPLVTTNSQKKTKVVGSNKKDQMPLLETRQAISGDLPCFFLKKIINFFYILKLFLIY